MFTSNAAAVAKSLGKRKMREETDNQFNPNGHHHLASSSVPADRRRSKVRKILNNAAATPSKPFSYMALLTADEDEDEEEDDFDYYPISKDVKNQSDQIDQMITYHNENLRQSVVGMLEKHNHSLQCAAEERAAKRMKERDLKLQEHIERNEELERLVEHYKGESNRLLTRVRYLEHEAAARRYADTVEEEGESSFEDPDRVGPVRLDCKVCERQLATVMVWPCRHVCVCMRCDATTKYCPVCRSVKTTSVEVCLPLD
ncbi:hypothetical protein C2S53_005792 [Perilla frutescens var. hirtella]|uniref:RING-type domain-containing protein n=1 Tax=Perilla frutescens var. hirtella TaxID=608512 RepID=A0AAD4JCY6_PERFH|nr:hypothetical protein C2S53_005792 [Perilla frutescens var. hirtella]